MYARKLTKKEKIAVVIGMIAWFVVCAFTGVLKGSDDYLRVGNSNYVPITFNQDIFAYDFCGTDDYIDEDETYMIEGGKFNMVYHNGDMYCLRNQEREAVAYYANDDNYHWQLVTMKGDEDEDEPMDITLSEEELDALYTVGEQEKDLTLYWDEIEVQGSLRKISEDGIVVGSTELAYYQGRWYWRSEIIDDSQTRDDTWPEYVYPLPEGFGGIELK